jgi:hypothetical protein
MCGDDVEQIVELTMKRAAMLPMVIRSPARASTMTCHPPLTAPTRAESGTRTLS